MADKTKWVMTYGRRDVVKSASENPALDHYGWQDLCRKEKKDLAKSALARESSDARRRQVTEK